MIEASRRNKVKKILVAGIICAYPRHTPVPLREEGIWNGFPEETSARYGMAKKSHLVMLDAYRILTNNNILNRMQLSGINGFVVAALFGVRSIKEVRP
jgi:nucleoside-diphosphate-sugar epimerase